MTTAPFTRYSCPLECGWHYDDPGPGPGEVTAISVQPGETFHDTVSRLAGNTARAHAGKVDAAFVEHLDTHTLLQAVTKVAEQRDELQRLRPLVGEYEAGENSAMADWDLALDGILPEGVDPLPTQVAAYLRTLQEENAQLRQTAARDTEK
jgi:hypothetical protein